MVEALIFLTISVVTYFGVGRYRDWSRGRLLDVPNERSSHVEPTPRGAGLVIVLVCLFGGLIAYLLSGKFPYVIMIAGGAGLGLVGWLDDLYSLPKTLKFSAHVMAAIFLIVNLGFFDYFIFGPYIVFLWLFGVLLTLLWVVGVINSFNLMDGIDGIAGTQAFVASLAWAAFGLVTQSSTVITLSLLVAGSSFAFLFYNWHPARVFSGDIGSTFLGFVFAALPVIAVYESRGDRGFILLFAASVIWPFIVDTSFTFVRRVFTVGLRVFEPHRTHVYQLAVASGRSHDRVALGYALLSLLLSVMAVSVLIWPGIGYMALQLSLVATTVAILVTYFVSVRGAGKLDPIDRSKISSV